MFKQTLGVVERISIVTIPSEDSERHKQKVADVVTILILLEIQSGNHFMCFYTHEMPQKAKKYQGNLQI